MGSKAIGSWLGVWQKSHQLPITGFAHKTGVVGDLNVRALLAAEDMPAHRCRAAVLDRRHYLELIEAHMAGIGRAPCRTMAAEDIRNLERRTRHARRASGRRHGRLERFDEMIERANHLTERIGGNARIESGGVELGMAEQHLDYSDIDILLQ